jgi:hypothetical protein
MRVSQVRIEEPRPSRRAFRFGTPTILPICDRDDWSLACVACCRREYYSRRRHPPVMVRAQFPGRWAPRLRLRTAPGVALLLDDVTGQGGGAARGFSRQWAVRLSGS